jgi:hypothetical protein
MFATLRAEVLENRIIALIVGPVIGMLAHRIPAENISGYGINISLSVLIL